MLVGDSMNRNQFESLLCLLREGLPDKSKMYETHGYKITKGRGYFMFKFEVNLSRSFFVSSLLKILMMAVELVLAGLQLHCGICSVPLPCQGRGSCQCTRKFQSYSIHRPH